MSRTPQVLGQIDRILQSIEASKTAAARTEPGSIGGATTHPSKNVDDRTSAATEGFRSKENEEDVRKAEGKPGVNSTAPATSGTAESAQYNIGTKVAPTGKEPSVETESAKGGKEDAGNTTSKARTDNDSLNGGKYASVRDAIDVLRDRTKTAHTLGHELLSKIAVSATAPQAAPTSKQAASAPATAPVPQAQAQAGYDFAGILSPEFDKQALDNTVVNGLAETVWSAEDQAVKAAEFLDNYFAAVKKAAEDEGGGGDDSSKGPPSADDSGGDPPPPPGGPGGDDSSGGPGGDPTGGDPTGGDPAAALQGIPPEILQKLIHLLLAQGGGAGGDPTGGAGGDPSMQAALQGGQSMGGGAAMAGMGAPGGDGPPPGGPPAGGDDQMGMLHQAMFLAGTNPDEVEAKAAQKSAAAVKAWAAKNGGQSGSWRPKTASELRALNDMTTYLRELTGRRAG